MNNRAVIVDYGASNLASVKKALEYVGLLVEISGDAAVVSAAGALVFPGQGEFGSGYRGLAERGLLDPLLRHIAADRPFLGLCLGLQLLLEHSAESPDVPGLGVFSGACRRFATAGLTVPHMGWNQVWKQGAETPLLEGIPDGTHFYFVHSYHPDGVSPEVVAATTEYGVVFPSMVARGRVAGCQFHPEKSQAAGLHLLQNFKQLCERT